MLIRTWNVFHGNASPPERRAFLEQAVRLAVADRPDVLCLQELPAWSLPRLSEWSGYAVVADVAARPGVGPLPIPAAVGGAITELNHGVFRSAFTGQGNAILVSADAVVVERRRLVLNAHDFRRREARRLRLTPVTRLAWAKERRVCQIVRLRCEEATMVVANLHATSYPDKRLASAELFRAATFVDGFAGRGEPVVLAGDFNVTIRNSSVLRRLTTAAWGFDGTGGTGIDHILVRGLEASPTTRWPIGRRRVDGRVLSDHAPAERRVG